VSCYICCLILLVDYCWLKIDKMLPKFWQIYEFG
jgi:hypothetical protein